MLRCEVGKRPVERDDAAPTPTDEFTADVVETGGKIPTPTFPRMAFCAATLLSCTFYGSMEKMYNID